MRGWEVAPLAGASAGKQQMATASQYARGLATVDKAGSSDAANDMCSMRRYPREVDVVLLVENGVPEVLRGGETVRGLDEREERAGLVQPELELPVELVARPERGCDTRPGDEPLQSGIRAFRPSGEQAEDIAGSERKVMGGIGEIGLREIEAKWDLAVAVPHEPGADVSSSERDVKAGSLQARLDRLCQRLQ